MLTGFLTIFIAVIGYNLLFGRVMSVREGTLAFVKIGAVFALATSWPAYRTLVYDLVTDGPAQLVAEIGPAAGIVGSDGTLLQRLDLTDRALAQLALLGPGSPPPGSMTEIVPPPFAGFNAFALGGSRILFLLTAVGALAAVRVVTGLMLALGPFFIAFLMFDSTRSLFEGWIRVIAGAALVAIGVTIVLGLELALLEPWLGGVLARRMAGEAVPTAPTELFVLVTLFTIVAMAAIYGCARVARAFRISAGSSLIPLEPARDPYGRAVDELEPAVRGRRGRSTADPGGASREPLDDHEPARKFGRLSGRFAGPGPAVDRGQEFRAPAIACSGRANLRSPVDLASVGPGSQAGYERMNEHSREALDAYYAEAASWNRDRVQAMRSSHRSRGGSRALRPRSPCSRASRWCCSCR